MTVPDNILTTFLLPLTALVYSLHRRGWRSNEFHEFLLD